MHTPRERLINALKGKETDRPPFICPGGMMNMVITEVMQETGIVWPEAHMKQQDMADLAMGVHRLTGIENLGAPFCMTVEAEFMGAAVQMGSIYNEPRVVGYPLSSLEEWSKLREIKPENSRAGVVGEAVHLLSRFEGDVPVIANLTGPVSMATSLVEPMLFFKAMGKKPELVHEFLNFVTDNLIVFGKSLIKAGAQVLTIADTSATGEILGPKRFTEFALPYFNRILTKVEDTLITAKNFKNIMESMNLKSAMIIINTVNIW